MAALVIGVAWVTQVRIGNLPLGMKTKSLILAPNRLMLLAKNGGNRFKTGEGILERTALADIPVVDFGHRTRLQLVADVPLCIPHSEE